MELKLELLAKFAPFNSLTFEYLIKVMEKASLKTFEKGAIIFKRGREVDEAYYLVEGSVDLIDSHFAVTAISHTDESCRFVLNSSAPTAFSAVAKSPVTMLVVESDFVDLVMAWSEASHEESGQGQGKAPVEVPAHIQIQSQVKSADQSSASEDENDWMSSLLQSPLFNKIPPGNIRQLFIRFAVRKVAADEIIIKEGERWDYFYVIESGSATVLDSQGKILAALRSGDYFGEEALVGDTTRNATIKMLTPGNLMYLGKDDFVTLLQEPVRRFITFKELINHPHHQIIDVRLPFERRMESVANSRSIPLKQLRKMLPDLDPSLVYVVTDDAGRRSDVAAQLLSQAGFETFILQQSEQHHVPSA